MDTEPPTPSPTTDPTTDPTGPGGAPPSTVDPATAEGPPAARRRRWPWVAAAAALALAVAIAGSLVVLRRHAGPSYPSAWDPRLDDIVKFDEGARGLTFKHPVAVDYLDDEHFNKTVTTEDGALSAEDRDEIQGIEATLRAVGLLSGPTSLLDQVNALQSKGVLAYYSAKTKRVTVRGTELTPALRVTLSHELTHVLQDQYFDIEPPKALTSVQRNTRKAIVEGDARHIEQKYAAQLSEADRKAYRSEAQEKAKGVTGDPSIPPFVLASQQVPYELGLTFVTALRARKGDSGLDPLFANPPTSDVQLADLVAYRAHIDPVAVPVPAVGPGETKLREDATDGALDWYFLSATRNDIHDALWLAHAWGGDAWVTYRDAGGRSCVKADYVPANPDNRDKAKSILDAWVAAGVSGTASVTTTETGLELESCDPGSGPSTGTHDQSMAALELLTVRNVLQANLPATLPDSAVDCVGNWFDAHLTLADMAKPAPELQAQAKSLGEEAAKTCHIGS